jgi:AcrR family transcriptional regulator
VRRSGRQILEPIGGGESAAPRPNRSTTGWYRRCVKRHPLPASAVHKSGERVASYESKDAIIEAIVDRDIEEAPGMLDAFSGADDLVSAMMDRLDETVERHLDRDRAALRLEILAEAARNPRIAEKLHSADAAARNRLIQALAGRLSNLGPGEVADRVEATAAIFQGLIVRAVHNPDLDRDAFVRTMRLVLRELVTNDTTAAPPR